MQRETYQTAGQSQRRDAQAAAAAAQRTHDKESKRARGALSCAECRRLKLKCDKTVPCSSCKRRGCSAICPNGSLITGQGTRFVLADTEKLHQKIAAMSDRIRQLEDALAILQSTQTRDPHPLLHRDLLKIKSSIELHAAASEGGEDALLGGGAGAGGRGGNERGEEEEDTEESQAIDAFGTLAIRDDGAATFYGRSAGSESLLIGEASSPNSSHPHSQSSTHTHGAWSAHAALPPPIRALARAFPFSHTSSSSSSPSHPLSTEPDLDHLVRTYLPPWSEAHRLCELYMEQAPWFFGAVTRRQLEEEVLPLWYEEAVPRPPLAGVGFLGGGGMAAAAVLANGGQMNGNGNVHIHANGAPNPGLPPTPPPQTPHDLALLFILLCFGALTDPSPSPLPSSSSASLSSSPSHCAVLAEAYYDLTKAALGLAPVLEGPPAVATVQALALMGIYEGMRGGENSIERTWAVVGLSTKLAQSIGLHRDCARWKLPPAEVQKRRALFWELFITDCWQSLATGRLATFSLPFVDCELPFDPDQTMTDDGVVQPSFPFWKARFGAECVAAVVQGTLTSRAPRYTIILELDRKVRDMELPAYAQGAPPHGAGLAQTMSHFMPTNYRELTLLYIHRCFFAHAIASHPQDPIKSQYAPSFLAGYRSACTILASVKQQFGLFPAQIARFWVLWTHAFSAAVMLASVVTHSSQSRVAPAALLELRMAAELFQQASAYGGRAGKFLPIIQRLQMKAQQTFIDTNSGIPPSIPNDIFKPTPPDNAKDELSIFSGKTHTVATKAPTPPSNVRSSTGGRPVVASSSSRGSPHGQGALFAGADNPSFAGVHPSLVSELHAFDGHIAAQIRDAYEVGGGMYARPMDNMRERRHQIQMAEREREQRERERLEMERQHAERQHAERQELEQQRVYREQVEQQRQMREHHERYQQQQQLLREQQRLQEAQRQLEEQAELERQRQLQQQHQLQAQQMQHQRQPPIRQEHRQQFQAQHPPYEQQYEPHEPYANPEHHAHAVVNPTPIPSQPSRHALAHSRSHSNLPHAYVPEHHQSQHQPPAQAQPQAQQHSMYIVPPEYRHQYPTPESTASPDSATSSHFPGHEQGYNHVHIQQQQQQPVQEGAYRYWPTQEMGYASVGQATQPQSHPQQHHYTPEAALEGIAADDRSLQETWQSYMYKVGSPRHFFED